MPYQVNLEEEKKIEEGPGLIAKKYSFVVYLSLKTMSPEMQGIELAELKLSYCGIPEQLYSKINIEKSKCLRYEEVEKMTNHMIKKVHIEV